MLAGLIGSGAINVIERDAIRQGKAGHFTASCARCSFASGRRIHAGKSRSRRAYATGAGLHRRFASGEH